MNEPVKLLFFSTKWCAACTAMKKAKTVEKLVERHPNVTVEHIVIEDEEAKPDDKAAETADAYDIQSTPTLVFEHEKFGELAREEGGLPLKALEELYEQAEARLEYKRKATMPSRPGNH